MAQSDRLIRVHEFRWTAKVVRKIRWVGLSVVVLSNLAQAGGQQPAPEVKPSAPNVAVAAESVIDPDRFQASLDLIKDYDALLVQAFRQSSDGWSVDEVILQTTLNETFLSTTKAKLAAAGAADGSIGDAAINWRLLTLRKAGKLPIKSTRRAAKRQHDWGPLAEIAMRSMQDQTKLSSDRIMSDPDLRDRFDRIAKTLNPAADGYAVRKAAFQLRKTRQLRPELILRLADWGRVVTTHPVDDLRTDRVAIDPHPGIYIFRDRTGYLYIGQTENLCQRIAEHLDQSHNASLAEYLKTDSRATVELHSFNPESRAREVRVRRAYESELIRSRQPKFNVLP